MDQEATTPAELYQIQGFIDGYGDGRAAWSTGVRGIPEVLAYLGKALPDTETSAILIRRPVEGEPGGEEIGPYRLIRSDARERLARHLYIEAAPEDWRPTAELAWDRSDERVRRERWLARADEMLAVVAGKEE